MSSSPNNNADNSFKTAAVAQCRYLQSRKPLGRGTFCSISVCYDLTSTDERTSMPKRYAIKTEVSEFQNSGIMDGESRALEYLSLMIPDVVPKFIASVDVKREVMEVREMRDLFADDGSSNNNDNISNNNNVKINGLVMELFEGEDMHELVYRTWQERTNGVNKSQQQCIIDPMDALELTLIILRILKKIHGTGMVHRDVKPSNFVRTSTDKRNREVKVVDFGLTKSFVVPDDSNDAVLEKPWGGTSMYDFKLLKQKQEQGDINAMDIDEDTKKRRAYYRQPRPNGKAEFRGASMYASPNVHALEEYCPRDDLFSCLFIFLDMTQGGLPWATEASARQRDECGKKKQNCLKEPQKFLHKISSPQALGHLANILEYLMNLSYFDMPDYDFLEKHLRGLAENLDCKQGFKLQWQCPKLPHQKLDKDIALQIHFLNMKNTIVTNPCNSSDVAKLRAFLNYTMPLMKEEWPYQYETFPEHHKPQYRKSNFVRAIEEALNCARVCDFFQSRSYYDVADTAERSKLMLDVSTLLYSLHSNLEIEQNKPLLPPPAINFRRQ